MLLSERDYVQSDFKFYSSNVTTDVTDVYIVIRTENSVN